MIDEEVLSVPNETEQLREQLLRAQRLSSVGTLASSVAHEFNNILTAIINYAKLGTRPDCATSFFPVLLGSVCMCGLGLADDFKPLGARKKLIGQIDLKDPIYSTPIAADGVLYVSTSSNLYAVSGEAK